MSLPPDGLARALAGRYQLDRELGAGGMATVYLAHDLRHGRSVAVKVFRPELARSLGTDRFLREIQLAGQLNHPHIVALIDSGEADGLLYYLMPFVDGETLRAKLRREGPLPIDTALHITREVADALSYAHRRGVIHRDIKPENVLLADGHAFLADFGIARALDTAAEQLTQTGFALGTPAYMAPEQAVGDKAVDGRADLYALGCVLYEMLTGVPPYQGPTQQAILVKRFTEPVPAVRDTRAEVPEWLDRLVTRTLDKDPAERPADAPSLLAALDHLLAPAPPRVSDASLVVLPFVNTSPDPDTDYFADGLTEEVIADLSNIRALKVIARNSAMRLKGSDKGVQTLGRELGVRYVLAGSVRRAGNQLRITAQLADAAEDRQVWAGKYSGTLEDVFDLQERLAREIVQALRITLTTDDRQRLEQRPHHDFAVFECYQRARYDIYKFTAEATERAIRTVQAGLAALGEHELLVAALGHASLNRMFLGGSEPAALAEAARCVTAIFARWPGSAPGRLLSGIVEYRRGNARGVVRALKPALTMKPNDPEVLIYLAIGYFLAGRFDQARTYAVPAVELDPANPTMLNCLGMMYFYDGRFNESVEYLKRGAALETDSALCRACHAIALLATDRAAEADPVIASLRQDQPDDPYTMLTAALAAAMRGDREEAMTALTPAVLAAARGDEMTSHLAAAAFARLGQIDEALDWLRHMIRTRGFVPYRYFAELDPFIAPLRGDARFVALLDEMKDRYQEFDG